MSGMLRISRDRHKVSYIFEPQARADLNDDGNFWNGDNIGMLRISGMLGQTSSVIPFRIHNLELICMMMGISGIVGMS